MNVAIEPMATLRVEVSLPDLIFLGYCAKVFAADGRELASVSECLAQRPPQWVDRWDFNRATCWNTEADAWACAPDGSKAEFRIFAYRLLPLLFDSSGEGQAVTLHDLFPKELPPLPTDPAPPHYDSIGYDIVERNAVMGMLGFGCSPLSCNRMSESIPVNRFCLLDELPTALAAARRFGTERPEPGPYVIVEVLSPANSI